MIAFVLRDGRSLNVRWKQRRVNMYQLPGVLHRGVAIPQVDRTPARVAWRASEP
jgi:hypothetical protein